MAGGNGNVRTLISLPEGLRVLVELYQKDRCLPSFSGALRELLETHPEIAKRASALYNGLVSESHPEGYVDNGTSSVARLFCCHVYCREVPYQGTSDAQCS